jgi:hypothetical protein
MDEGRDLLILMRPSVCVCEREREREREGEIQLLPQTEIHRLSIEQYDYVHGKP